MQNPNIRIILCAIAFIVLVGTACNVGSSGDPTATSEPVIQVQQEEEVVPPTATATDIPLPTATDIPLPTATTAPLPTATTAPQTEDVYEAPAYFIEEFEGDLNSWTYFLIGNDTDWDLYADGGYLVFDLNDNDQYVYILYDEYTYSSVRIDVLADNRGKNSNYVSLVCNYSDSYGWYEYNISNNGLYELYVYSEFDGGYIPIDSGGSININMGRAENEYTMICNGNQMALYINGYLENQHTDPTYNLREGQVGFGVSSLDVTPINVLVDYFAISQP